MLRFQVRGRLSRVDSSPLTTVQTAERPSVVRMPAAGTPSPLLGQLILSDAPLCVPRRSARKAEGRRELAHGSIGAFSERWFPLRGGAGVGV